MAGRPPSPAVSPLADFRRQAGLGGVVGLLLPAVGGGGAALAGAATEGAVEILAPADVGQPDAFPSGRRVSLGDGPSPSSFLEQGLEAVDFLFQGAKGFGILGGDGFCEGVRQADEAGDPRPPGLDGVRFAAGPVREEQPGAAIQHMHAVFLGPGDGGGPQPFQLLGQSPGNGKNGPPGP